MKLGPFWGYFRSLGPGRGHLDGVWLSGPARYMNPGGPDHQTALAAALGTQKQPDFTFYSRFSQLFRFSSERSTQIRRKGSLEQLPPQKRTLTGPKECWVPWWGCPILTVSNGPRLWPRRVSFEPSGRPNRPSDPWNSGHFGGIFGHWGQAAAIWNPEPPTGPVLVSGSVRSLNAPASGHLWLPGPRPVPGSQHSVGVQTVSLAANC